MSTTGLRPLPLGAQLLHVPVGRPVLPSGGRLHVMDGDGASLCERVDAEDLLEIHGLRWRDVPLSMRCATCRAIMQGSTTGAG